MWVTPRGEFDAFATTPFRPSDLQCRSPPAGCRPVGVYRGSFLNWGKRRLWVLAPPPMQRTAAWGEPAAGGKPGARHGATTRRRMGCALAGSRRRTRPPRGPGVHAALPATDQLPRGRAEHEPRLAAGLDHDQLAGLRARLGERDPSAYVIQTQPDAVVAQVARGIRRALAPSAGLTVETYIEREQRHYALAKQGLSRLTQIRLLVLIAAMLAIGGAMGALIWQRRDLVAFIKCEGYRQGVLWRWLLCESAILLVAGCSIGAVFGLYGELLLQSRARAGNRLSGRLPCRGLDSAHELRAGQRRCRCHRCSRRLPSGARASEDSQPGVLTRPGGHLPQVPPTPRRSRCDSCWCS